MSSSQLEAKSQLLLSFALILSPIAPGSIYIDGRAFDTWRLMEIDRVLSDALLESFEKLKKLLKAHFEDNSGCTAVLKLKAAKALPEGLRLPPLIN
jgi:hypothetical protein